LNYRVAGVQIFLSTHDFVVLKEFDLQSTIDDKIRFHSLYRNPENGEIDKKAQAIISIFLQTLSMIHLADLLTGKLVSQWGALVNEA